MIGKRSFVALDKAIHDTKSFKCGLKRLDEFLIKRASNHKELGVSKTMVLPAIELAANGKYPIQAYYTVASTTIRKDSLPPVNAKPLPPDPIPASLITCIAVDLTQQGVGLGKITTLSALRLLLRASKSLPSHCVCIEPYNERAKSLYVGFGFQELDNTFLFLPMKTAEDLFND